VSEFDKLKDEAEKGIQEHPQQVKEGEEAIEKKLGVDSQDNQLDFRGFKRRGVWRLPRPAGGC
jgi:hypothetical protein